MAEFLLELLSEEIPAGMQERAAADLKRLVTDGLKDAGLAFDSARAFSGPRRLTLVVDGLPMQQPDRTEERKGPRADAPDKAIEGFLKSVGLTRDQVEERDTKKGKVLFAVTEEEGKATADVLGGIIFQILSTLTWPKSMRWPQMVPVTWVRPMRTLLAISKANRSGRRALPFTTCRPTTNLLAIQFTRLTHSRSKTSPTTRRSCGRVVSSSTPRNASASSATAPMELGESGRLERRRGRSSGGGERRPGRMAGAADGPH